MSVVWRQGKTVDSACSSSVLSVRDRDEEKAMGSKTDGASIGGGCEGQPEA